MLVRMCAVLVRAQAHEPWREAGRIDVEQRSAPVQPSVHRISPSTAV